jgi:hypothetical protein
MKDLHSQANRAVKTIYNIHSAKTFVKLNFIETKSQQNKKAGVPSPLPFINQANNKFYYAFFFLLYPYAPSPKKPIPNRSTVDGSGIGWLVIIWKLSPVHPGVSHPKPLGP